ncbi:uncharacterized protein EV154DRAFT_479343 [Mucor mucedo]|uniref:uncharacterized protein n=1 Tax=Mucor mucedo TaxID=29922 RepID=UPI00221FA351|nr:uncharacterized protein EV154DRAFT_479343 [Mucor mucedo]KAI7893333.1 hypothetical protein EV154DRAFT_479343 [Mucor mucedo]
MSVHSFNDTVSVIDLSRERYSSMSSGVQSYPANQYRISLQSINDDDLELFHRDLVTPTPSVCDEEEDDLFSRNFVRTRFPRPASRTESVMLFKKINNGDKDVSVDPVSNEVLETDSFMDSFSSHSESRMHHHTYPARTDIIKLLSKKNENVTNSRNPSSTRRISNETLESLSARLSRINRSNNTSRTESLSLFKKIKNGDKDVSVDHLSEETLDTNSIMNGMPSRPQDTRDLQLPQHLWKKG